MTGRNDNRSHVALDVLLSEAEGLESSLRALRQDATARLLRDMRLRLTDVRGMEGVAAAAVALVEDVRRHARETGVSEDEADLDDDLWRALRMAVDAWRGEGSR